MNRPGWRACDARTLRAVLVTLAIVAGCANETRIRVDDFTRPVALDHVAPANATIVGMVLEVSGRATETIAVEVRCKDKVVRRFDVSGAFRQKVKVDAYAACINLAFHSSSFVDSSMTVSYAYTVL